MINQTTANILRFVTLIIVQVFLLKNIGYYNLAVPFIYPLFILRLPMRIQQIALYTLCFLMGISIDTFYNTPGLHTTACVSLGLFRIYYLKIGIQQDKFENEPEPGIKTMGAQWFLVYASVLTFAHHFILFFIEIFRLTDIGFVFTRAILSTLFSVTLMSLTELMFWGKKR